MSSIRVASRYAKSLLELAVEKGVLSEVYHDMELLSSLNNSNPELAQMLYSPIINSERKLSVLEKMFSNSASKVTLSFFELLADKNRMQILMSVVQEFHKQYNLHQGIQLAEVTTTFKIGDSLKQEFTNMAKKISGLQKVELIEKINPQIIGGFILQVNDWQLDESLSSKLNALRLEFSKNLYEKQF